MGTLPDAPHVRARVQYMADKSFDQAYGFSYLCNGVRRKYNMADFKHDVANAHLVMGKMPKKHKLSAEEH